MHSFLIFIDTLNFKPFIFSFKFSTADFLYYRYEVAFPSGISHYLEKLAFNATTKYKSKDDILHKLEQYGGKFISWLIYPGLGACTVCTVCTVSTLKMYCSLKVYCLVLSVH